ncbi:MAG: tRNA (adenosine(37)-N6)-dimethylallyltransferase MiaA [Chthonomonadales bacterium]
MPADEEFPIIAIVGPTATGKTAAALRVALALEGEVISADSVAVYRGLDIGTAKPAPSERAIVPFHLLDVADPGEGFTAGCFKKLAEQALAGIRLRKHRPILCGGTGLYVRVFLDDYGLTGTPADLDLRRRLEQEARIHGTEKLHDRLRALDPIAAERIHPRDLVRIVRALEVTLRTGVPVSEQHRRDARARKPKKRIMFGLTMDRKALYRRIEERVDAMMEAGFVEEVRGLLERGVPPQSQAMRSLGYKEMVRYLQGEIGLDEAVSQIKHSTKQFARRQITWFQAEPGVDWLDVSGMDPAATAEEILRRLGVR